VSVLRVKCEQRQWGDGRLGDTDDGIEFERVVWLVDANHPLVITLWDGYRVVSFRHTTMFSGVWVVDIGQAEADLDPRDCSPRRVQAEWRMASNE